MIFQVFSHLARARELTPGNGSVLLLSGVLARRRGHLDQAVDYLQKAVEADSSNVRALYLLAEIAQERNASGSGREALVLMDRILEQRPGNLLALLERARLAAEQGQEDTLLQSLNEVQSRIDDVPQDIRELLTTTIAAAQDGRARDVAAGVAAGVVDQDGAVGLLDPAVGEGAIDDLAFDGFDGDGRIGDAEHAGVFAGCGADAAGRGGAEAVPAPAAPAATKKGYALGA